VYELTPQRSFGVVLENGARHVTASGGSKQPLVFRSGNTYALGSSDSTTTVTVIVEECGSPTFAHACQRAGELRLATMRRSSTVRSPKAEGGPADAGPTRENAAHQNLFSTLIRRQVVEKSGAVTTVRLNRFPSYAIPSGKNSLLQSLLVVERRLHPQV
jgi:hypothetical protein